MAPLLTDIFWESQIEHDPQTGFERQLSMSESQFCQLLMVWLWANYLTPLSLYFLTYKMRLVVVSTAYGCGEKKQIIQVVSGIVPGRWHAQKRIVIFVMNREQRIGLPNLAQGSPKFLLPTGSSDLFHLLPLPPQKRWLSLSYFSTMSID